LGVFGHPTCAGEGLAQEHLDVRVDAAELICRPPGERVVHIGVDAEQDLFAALAHV
jgi:hypothetical protein